MNVKSEECARAPRRARLRACRSLLLTPASRPDGFADAHAGDGIIVDLESTVSPADKPMAREAALAYLCQPAEAGFARILRINSPRSVEGLADLLALHASAARPDAVLIPKCQSADEIRIVADILNGTQAKAGIIPMVELARALFAVDAMAQAHERVCGLFLGGGDMAGDLGADGAWESLLLARSQIVAAAATAGIAAIDSPYFKGDSAGLEREAAASRKLGMTGKAALHAEQLAVISTIFTPAPDVVSHARSVLAAAAGGGVAVLAGHVIEPAMIREAERVLAIATRQHDHAPGLTQRVPSCT